MEFECLGLQRMAQIEFESSARLGAGLHFCFKPAPCSPALGFRLIQRHVGVSQKLVWINLAFGDRNPDAGGDDNFVSVQIVGTSERGQYALGESFRLIEATSIGACKTTNSSPPKLAMTPASRAASISRLATASRSMSPRVCPKVSFTCLNWSRSMK